MNGSEKVRIADRLYRLDTFHPVPEGAQRRPNASENIDRPHNSHNVQYGAVSGSLGRVDGFDQDEAESKGNERAVALISLLAA